MAHFACVTSIPPSEVMLRVITHCTLILCARGSGLSSPAAVRDYKKFAAWPTTRISSVDPAQKVKTP